MSIEIYVFSDRRLPSLVEWQRSIDAEGIALFLPSDTSISDLRGYLPVRVGTMPIGFECDHWDAQGLIAFYPDVEFGRPWSYCLAFRWGSDFDEGLAAYEAAAAYAKATNGVVFDPQDGVVMSPQRAFEVARQMQADMPKMKEAVQAAILKLRKP